jgi:hypothetical protein
MMVNYRYALDRVAPNQIAYAADRRVEASSIKALLGAADAADAEANGASEPSRGRALLQSARALATSVKRRMGHGSQESG